MPWSRRAMLSTSALGLLGLRRGAPVSVRPTAPLRVLVLGGTGFLGPHMVREALTRGHRITLFTRGRSGTELFPDVERLTGDRAGNLEALRGHRWDAVIDNSGYFPAHVAASTQALQASADHYFYTSTIDAYRDFHTVGITEDYPLAVLPANAPHDANGFYGPLKALCEQEVRRAFPGRHTIVRPGWVAGPGDNNHLFTYWVMRTARGGRILAPGTPNDPVQLTDARDLAAFAIDAVEQRHPGAYNLVGPVLTFGEMLGSLQRLTATPGDLTWVDADFLRQHKVLPYFDLPLWWPPRNDYEAVIPNGGLGGGIGAFTINGAKARAVGYTSRALDETARDTLRWYREAFGTWEGERRPGLSVERETTLLEAWRAARRAPP